MVTAIYIILGILVLWLFIYDAINSYRQKIEVRMNMLYDKMELYVVQNNIVLDNDTIEYLKGFKRLVINPEYLDVHVLFVILQNIPKNKMEEMKRKRQEILKKIPQELKDIAFEFDKQSRSLLTLSVLRPAFVLFLIYCLLKNAFKSVIHRSVSEFKAVFSKVNETLQFQQIISGSPNQHKLAA